MLVDIVLPIFLIVIAGWLLAYFDLIPEKVAAGLMQYVFYAACPAIIFLTISSYEIEKLLVWRFWIAYPLSIFVTVISAFAVFRYFFRRDVYTSAIAGFCSALANTIMLGFPVLMGIAGKHATVPMAMTVIIANCLVVPGILFIFELHAKKETLTEGRAVVRAALLSTVKNPLIISAALGVIFSLFEIKLPTFLVTFFRYLGASIIPCALFSIGVELRFFKVSGNLAGAFVITLFNLLIRPALAILIALLLELSPFYSVALVIFSSVPTAKSMFIYAGNYRFFEKEAAAVISLTTLASLLTIPCFIAVCHHLWPEVFLHGVG